MPEEELQIMKKYLEWYDSCPGASADGFLFGMDQPIIPKLLNKRFHRVADAAGLPQIRIHDLRHSHATLLINHGANYQGHCRSPRKHSRRGAENLFSPVQ